MNQHKQSLARETLTLLKPFRLLVIAAAIMGIISGLSITALLSIINEAISASNGPDQFLVSQFAGLCLLILTCTTLSNLFINYVGQNVVLRLRRRLAKKIMIAPIEQLERFRSHRLIPILVQDVQTISLFALNVAPLLISFAVTTGCFIYLALLSWEILLLTLSTLVIGSGVQYLSFKYGRKYIDIARDSEDDLQEHYKAIADGAKELRIQRPRRQHMFHHKITGTAKRICHANIRAGNIFISAETFGSMLFFIVIGIPIAFQAMSQAGNTGVTAGFVLVMLYMKGPLEHLITTLPEIATAQVAFERINNLSEQFSSPEPQLLIDECGHTPKTGNCHENLNSRKLPTQKSAQFSHLELNNIHYKYPSVDGRPPFTVGPIDISIDQGDIVFIVGENGSGKTSLIKLLLGLYRPHEGQVILDKNHINEESLDDYRQLFTTIFSDYYLFEELANGITDLPIETRKYLKRLNIEHKVKIEDGSFTTTDLSTGQRKRLALINAWIEDRPILVFDEWAADQDPAFRRVFYTELLPELRALGKTIIVISHDDKYFYVADKIIQMNTGKMITEEEVFA